MTRLLPSICLLFLLVGCADTVPDRPGTPFCADGCELEPDPAPADEPPSTTNPRPSEPPPPNPTPTPTPVEGPALFAVFVAGHLGSYESCPEEGYAPDADSGFGGTDGDGVCEDPDNCSFQSCEVAQVTLSLRNDGEVIATGIDVAQIELFGLDNVSRAVLPWLATTDTATNEPFDGDLEAGEEVLLRVEYRGPRDPYSLLAPLDSDGVANGYGGILETTFSSDNYDDVSAAGEMYPVPTVDT